MPIVITSLSAPTDIVPRVHEYGGMVFHDVVKVRHAEKALEAGVDGIIAVCNGAGGHAGTLNPFALVNELRRIHKGPLVLSGAITNGDGVLAAEAMGCDLAYLGTRFIASKESLAVDRYKQMIVESSSGDIVYTPLFSGVHGSYLAGSIRNAGLDPDNLPVPETPGKYRSPRRAREDVEGHLGRGPGRGQHRRRTERRGAGRSARVGVPRGAAADRADQRRSENSDERDEVMCSSITSAAPSLHHQR